MCHCTAPELWAPIPNWDDLYQASTHGQIRSVDRFITCRNRWGTTTTYRRRGQILKTGSDPKTGRLYVNLHRGGEVRCASVHVLVLEAFAGPRPTPDHDTCHWDDDPAHNCIGNLRWDTKTANAADKLRNGRNDRATRTVCPRKHLLFPPNLVATCPSRPDGRMCLACNRAYSRQATARRRGEPFDFQAVADTLYREITATAL